MTETIYDEQVAPLLLRAARICQEHGLPMITLVEYKPGVCGRTAAQQHDGVCPDMRLADYACRANGNLDAFLLAVRKDAKKHGHTSVYLSLLDSMTEPLVSP